MKKRIIYSNSTINASNAEDTGYDAYSQKPKYLVSFGHVGKNGELEHRQPIAQFYSRRDADEYAKMKNSYSDVDGWFYELEYLK